MVFVGVWFVVAVLTRGAVASQHEGSRLGTIESLVVRHSFQLDGSTYESTTDKIRRDGHYYSHQTPILAPLEAPIFAVLHAAGLRFGSGSFDPAYYLLTLLTNGVALALTVVLIDRIQLLAGVAPSMSVVLAVWMVAATWLFPYGVVNNNHGVAGALLALMAYLLLLMELDGASRARCWWLGIALGLMSAIEVLPLGSFAPLAFWFLWKINADTRRLQWFASGFMAPLAVHALINIPITGDVIPAGLHGELFDYSGSVFSSATLTGFRKDRTSRELISYTWRALFADKAYFVLAPVLAIGVATGIARWRWWQGARGTHVVLLLGSAISLALAVATSNNYGGGAVGFRYATYLAPAFIVMLLPLTTARDRVSRICTAAVLVVAIGSAAVLFVFAMVQPWKPLTIPLEAPTISWRLTSPVLTWLFHY